MHVAYINPFISGTTMVFRTVLGTTPRRTNLGLKKGFAPPCDMTVLTGLSGDLHGSVAFSFPRESAVKIVAGMLGEPEAEDAIIADALGELANMITGAAKKDFSDNDLKMFFSIPRA